MTRRRSSNQYSGGIVAHPAPKNSECKNPLENFSSRIFGIKMAYSSLIIFQRAKLSTLSITHLSGAIEGHFEGKTPREGYQGFLLLARKCPDSRSLATQKKLVCLGFHSLDHPPYSPDLATSHYYLFSVLKKQLKGGHFSSDAEVIAAAETWLDGQGSDFFFSGLQKFGQRAKKCTELREECVE